MVAEATVRYLGLHSANHDMVPALACYLVVPQKVVHKHLKAEDPKVAHKIAADVVEADLLEAKRRQRAAGQRMKHMGCWD